MRENEAQLEDNESQKARIRARYKGIDLEELDIIPAIPKDNFYESTSEKRVAVYARVSTDDPRQTSSYELQKNHYADLVQRHPGWNLVEIYADEGISGTSLQHRNAFINMIQDCHDGKFDLIVTKSVARFSRNFLDCISNVRKLAALRPPVGVFFETENIYTLNSNSEMLLSFIATIAQEESHNKSEIMNSSIEARFRRGIFLTPRLLGYDQDENGHLIINEAEAKTVRLIFFMYLYGYTCVQIADTMTRLGHRTKKGNTSWAPGSILQILQNERHCGDVLARKTWTPNYLDHKSKKNNQDRNQYRKRNHHEAIISRDDFIAVQHLITNARYGNKGILPELKVISEGALKGFVSVNPRWGAFSADDYRSASESVYENEDQVPAAGLLIEAQSGDFDLRGFEIARSQFFDTARKLCVTFSTDDIVFSTECIRKFEKTQYIEMLIHPIDHLLVVRPCTKETKNAIQWSKLNEGEYYSRSISGAAYIKTLYDLFCWKSGCKYRMRGIYRCKDNEAIIIFYIKETELFIPQTTLEFDWDKSSEKENDLLLNNNAQPFTIGPKKDIMAYPSAWADNFGSNFYRHAQARELAAFNKKGVWNVSDEGQAFSDSPRLNITSMDVIKNTLRHMNCTIEQETKRDGE
ncbi:recombinase family protein [Anaerosinus sp.]|uniref:recombinase family protein n=1 Tax=Selenobaculum sp. TaxID=3074374 RepID=UPI003AB237D4